MTSEEPFRTDLDYYEGRAEGIASVKGVTIGEARRDLASRHGFGSWEALSQHIEAMAGGAEPPTPFVLAYRALEANDREGMVELLGRFPDLVGQRGTNGNDLLGMAGSLELVSLLLARGADPNRGTTTGGRSSTRRATRMTASSPGCCSRRERALTCSRAATEAHRSLRRSSGATATSPEFWVESRATCESAPAWATST